MPRRVWCRPSTWRASMGHVVRLRREQQRRRAARVQARWLTPRALLGLTGIGADGAILTRGNGQVDPCKACLGLAVAAGRHDALIFEQSPVSRMRHDSKGVVIEVGLWGKRDDIRVHGRTYGRPDHRRPAARGGCIVLVRADSTKVGPSFRSGARTTLGRDSVRRSISVEARREMARSGMVRLHERPRQMVHR
jgi:hypothetical protein